MASVSSVFTCPSCNSALTQKDMLSDKCPACFKSFKNTTNKYFEEPLYLLQQRDSLLEDLEKNKLQPGDKVYNDKYNEIHNSLTDYIRNSDAKDISASLTEAHLYMRSIIHMRLSGQELKVIISIANKIGSLGKILDQYVKEGGIFNDGKTRQLPTEPGIVDRDQAAINEGWDR